MTAEFDRYGGRYEDLMRRSIGFSGRGHDFFLKAKADDLLDLARRLLGDPAALSALDVGCGTGLLDAHLRPIGDLHGVDVSEAMIEEARAANPWALYEVADGAKLPYSDGRFDFVLASCLLHHVPREERGAVVRELARVTRRGGLTVVLEHNPLNPLTRLAVMRCEFDDDAVLLGRREARARLAGAGLDVAEERYILVFPWRAGPLLGLERALGRAPLGAQYYVAARA